MEAATVTTQARIDVLPQTAGPPYGRLLAAGSYALVIGMYALYALAPRSVLDPLTGEDRVVEWIGTSGLLLAGVLFALAFARSRGRGLDVWRLRTSRNWLVLGMALVMFLAAGEEISWGQRIFGWDTPASIAAVNEQDETNLHNLKALNPVADGEWKSGFRRVFTANRLFAFFVLGFATAWPLLHGAARWVRTLNEHVHLPVPPLWAAPLALLVLVLVRPVSERIPPGFDVGHVHELKETLYSVVLVIVAWYAYLQARYSGASK